MLATTRSKPEFSVLPSWLIEFQTPFATKFFKYLGSKYLKPKESFGVYRLKIARLPTKTTMPAAINPTPKKVSLGAKKP